MKEYCKVGRLYVYKSTMHSDPWVVVRLDNTRSTTDGSIGAHCAELFGGELKMDIWNVEEYLLIHKWVDVTDLPPDYCPVELQLLSRVLLA